VVQYESNNRLSFTTGPVEIASLVPHTVKFPTCEGCFEEKLAASSGSLIPRGCEFGPSSFDSAVSPEAQVHEDAGDDKWETTQRNSCNSENSSNRSQHFTIQISLFDNGVGLDFHQPIGINEADDLHHRVSRPDVPEEIAVDEGYFFPILDSREKNPRAHNI
jgi:hypothetical protein